MNTFRSTGLALALIAGFTGCDTTVSNPGRFEDTYLNDRNAATAMVNGAGRALSAGMNWISYTGAAVTREIHPAGSTGSFGITTLWQKGELRGDDGDLDTHWEQAQRARWIAEEAVRRIEAAKPPTAIDLQICVLEPARIGHGRVTSCESGDERQRESGAAESVHDRPL